MDIVIDLQRFGDNREKCIPKEIALVTVNDEVIGHWIVKQPFPQNQLTPDVRKRNNWVTTHHHGINWTDGYTPLC